MVHPEGNNIRYLCLIIIRGTHSTGIRDVTVPERGTCMTIPTQRINASYTCMCTYDTVVTFFIGRKVQTIHNGEYYTHIVYVYVYYSY